MTSRYHLFITRQSSIACDEAGVTFPDAVLYAIQCRWEKGDESQLQLVRAGDTTGCVLWHVPEPASEQDGGHSIFAQTLRESWVQSHMRGPSPNPAFPRSLSYSNTIHTIHTCFWAVWCNHVVFPLFSVPLNLVFRDTGQIPPTLGRKAWAKHGHRLL